MGRKRVFLLSFFLLGTVLLYLPTLGNGFLTDDYASLYRLFVEKRILYRESLRPLMDITFYLNWVISGFHPVGYYIFNFLVHALTCYMVYQVAVDLPLLEDSQREAGAMTAGFLFLIYPFHAEGIVWLSGRLASMAALFGLLSIHFSLTRRGSRGFLPAVLCWFAGLFAYESILVLPGIILVLEWMKYREPAKWLRLAGAWVVAGIVWLVMHNFVAGVVLSAYGKAGIESDNVGARILKVFGRCFLPPLENSRIMIGLFAGLILGVGLLHVLVWRRLSAKAAGSGQAKSQGRQFLVLEVIFLISLLPAFAFGVSTRTEEGDRLLYFPSCLLCLLANSLLFFLFRARRWRLLCCLGLAAAGLFFIQRNNQRWVFASRTASSVLDTIRAASGRVVLVNAPDEWEGAYIFRNNFLQGLVVNGIDTNKVVVAHLLTRLEYLPVAGRIEPSWKDSLVSIYPATQIVTEGERFRVLGVPGSFNRGGDRVYYWDKYELKPLILTPR